MINKCEFCKNELKKIVVSSHVKFRCGICLVQVKTSEKSCPEHSGNNIIPFELPEKSYYRKCTNCVNITRPKVQEVPLEKKQSKLERVIQFDRRLMSKLNKKENQPMETINIVLDHIRKYNAKGVMTELNRYWLPESEMDEILEITGSDKWVEKTKLANIVLWTLSMFLNKEKESFSIQDIANASASLLGRKLTNTASADHNSIGVRLENENLIKGLEMILQSCSEKLQTKVFEEGEFYVNVYYDWFYIVKTGNVWSVCGKSGKGDNAHAIKIGIGYEWDTNAVVSLVMHGDSGKNDSVSFRENLMITERPGIVHITDRGPFSFDTMREIQKNNQHFIIRLKDNTLLKTVHPSNLIPYTIFLDTASNPKVTILEEKIVKLKTANDIGELTYVKFQYKSLRTGKFETVKLISTLRLPTETIMNVHAWRWVATEIEFRTLQHQFGLEKIFLKKPEKVWPLLLLVLSGKMLMELTYHAVHSLHGRINRIPMQTARFRRGFDNFVTALFNDEDDPVSMFESCGDPYCPFNKKHGQRRK